MSTCELEKEIYRELTRAQQRRKPSGRRETLSPEPERSSRLRVCWKLASLMPRANSCFAIFPRVSCSL